MRRTRAICPLWFAPCRFGFFANRRRQTALARCCESLGAVACPDRPKQQPSCVVPPAPAPCWSSNGSRALNFTSGQTRASLPHRGAALTAHKTAIAYDVSTPVAPWHACTCKALVCPQAVQAPRIRHCPTPCRAQFCPLTGLPQLRWFNLAPAMASIRQPAPLKIHS